MPSLSPDQNESAYQIRSYEPGMLKINTLTLTQSVIITPNQLIQDWPPQTIAELTRSSLDIILSLKPHILLIGTGPSLIFPELSIYGDLINHGIGVEIMSTRAACHTYHALSAENRQVAAALIIR